MIRSELIAPVSELLERQAKRCPDKVAYRDAARSVTFGELERDTRHLATWLCKLSGGARPVVAVWLPNSVDWIVTTLAAVRAGGMAVPVSYDSMVNEAAYRIEDAQCTFVVTRAERSGMLDEIDKAGEVKRILVDPPAGVGDSADPSDFVALCAQPAEGVELPVEDIDEASYIIYTSGTTGLPKGVLISTRAILWTTAACWWPTLGINENDRLLSPLPLFHSYALTLSVLAVLATGAEVYLMERFSTKGAIEMLKSGDFTLMPGVPTMFHYLMQAAADEEETLFGSMRYCISAGAILPGTLNRDFEKRFGVQLLDGYGITEMSTMVTMNWPGAARIPGSCGPPLLGLALRVIDPATGKDVPFGEEGELICRGPNLMIGYNRMPEKTNEVLRDGWYYSGDLARSDKNGFITITGRVKEIIIRGGQNIAPAEVEEIVTELDEVLDCAIVGISHESLGEVPVAFIVPKPGKPVEEEAVRSHCAAHLSAYKVPAKIELVEEIPRTGSGKIMRFKLRERLEGKA